MSSRGGCSHKRYSHAMNAPAGTSPEPDPALDEVAEYLMNEDPSGARWATVFRHTFDMIYNGQETGRYKWDQLMKTEKTHFGTLFEINAQREFGFDGGTKTDYRIAGHEVDAKWSQSLGGWMLPPEVFGELALVATADDAKSVWSVGLIRVLDEFKREKGNRDAKSQLNPLGRDSIRWLWRDEPLTPNVLLQLPQDVVDYVLEPKDGTQRVNRLFRAAEGLIVHRNTVATVSRQLDHQKRVRYNGGARSALAPDGFIILSGAYHAHIAEQLDLPIPSATEYVSVRVSPSEDETGAVIDGRHWRRFREGDPVSSAPMLPERGTRE